MPSLSNNASPNLSPQSALNRKVAQLIALPTYDNEAPGKTGANRYPIRVTQIKVQYNGFEGSTPPSDSKIGIWNSDGTQPAYSANISLTTTADAAIPPFQTGTLSKPARGGNQYWVGATNPPGGFLTWGVDNTLDSPFVARVREDNTSHLGNFNDDDFLVNNTSSFNGQLSFELQYETAPSAVRNFSASESGSFVSLTWQAPLDDGDGTITGYKIQRSSDAGETFDSLVVNSGSTATSFSDNSALPGQTYIYRVSAHNTATEAFDDSFTGPFSATQTVEIGGIAGNTTSLLETTITKAEPDILQFADFGDGIPFGNLQVVLGSENLFNRIKVTPATGAAQSATAQESVDDYGLRVFGVSTLNIDDGGALSVANEFLYRFFQPDIRVDSIQVFLSNLTEAQKNAILELDLDSGAAVQFQPRRPGGDVIGEPIKTTSRVIGIAHDVSPTDHIVTIKFDREQTIIFTLDSVVNGILDQNLLG